LFAGGIPWIGGELVRSGCLGSAGSPWVPRFTMGGRNGVGPLGWVFPVVRAEVFGCDCGSGLVSFRARGGFFGCCACVLNRIGEGVLQYD
jgi:hypothetical protein